MSRRRTKTKKSGKMLFFILILAIVCADAPVSAQENASLAGILRDPSSAAIPAVTVCIRNLDTDMQRKVETDQDGRFHAPSLPVGSYEIIAEKPGFRTERRTGIVLVVGQRAELDFTLSVGDVYQSVAVTAEAGSLMTTTEDISGLVEEKQVKNLPLNGRSYDQLLTLNPGAINYTSERAGSTGTSNSEPGNMFSVSGHRPQENLFLLNGVEYTGASEISNTPGGVSGQLLGVDAVREFALVKDSYGAEFGKRPGAQVSIVSASGSNQFHGSAYEFVRNSALDARNFFDLPQIPDFQRNDFGGSLGGPIRRDKTFFFLNYEGYRQDLGLSDVTLVPDNASRAAAVPSVKPQLALWPVANGPEILTSTGASSGIATAYSSPQQSIREDFGTTRLDQNFSNQDSFVAV